MQSTSPYGSRRATLLRGEGDVYLYLEDVTGALRIYTAALGESFPHLHAHLVPRYAKMPNDVKAWGVFDLHRATEAGEVEVDENEVAEVARRYSDALARYPPPR